MSSIRRYVIEIALKVPRTEEAIFFLNQIPLICRQLKAQQVSLLVPSKKHFPTTDLAAAIDRVWGQDAIRGFYAGSNVRLPDGVTIRLESLRTINEHKSYDMVAAAYLGQKDLDVLDSLHARAVVLLPGLDDEGKDWLSRWNAEVLRQKVQETTPPRLDPNVELALESLAREILPYKRLTYGTNKQQAQKMFADLKNRGLSFDPSGIRIWALRRGWDTRIAGDLEAMAAKYCGQEQ